MSMRHVLGLVRGLPLLCSGSLLPVFLPVPAFGQAADVQAVDVQAAVEIGDPLLTPVPSAARRVKSWAEAATLALRQAPSVGISRAREGKATALVNRVTSESLPRLSASAQLEHHVLTGNGVRLDSDGVLQDVPIPRPNPQWWAGATLSQPVLALGTWYGISANELGAKAAGLDVIAEQRAVLFSLVGALIEVALREQLASVSRESLRAALASLQLARRREASGMSAPLDTLRFEQQVSTARAALIASDASLVLARQRLGLLFGTTDEWGAEPGLAPEHLIEDISRTCRPILALGERADVRSASLRAKASGRNRQRVELRRVPEIALRSTLNWTNSTFTPNGNPLQWTVGAVVSVPLYDGGAISSEVDEARADEAEERQRLRALSVGAELEAKQAKQGVAAAQAMLEQSVRVHELASAAANSARVAFGRGASSSFEVVQAIQELWQSEAALMASRAELQRSKAFALVSGSNCLGVVHRDE